MLLLGNSPHNNISWSFTRFSSYYEKFTNGKEVCIDDEIPFAIPESWQWERWGNLSYSIQYGYNAPAEETGDIRMVRISDIQHGDVLWATVPFCHINESEIDTYLLQKDDILFARTGGTVGKSFLVKDVPYPSIYAGYLIRTRYSNMLSAQYMKYFMECELYWEQLRNGTIATAQPNCNGKTLAKMILPIPPYNEQIRITDKLNQVLEQVRKYGESQDRLHKLDIQIHDLLKKSILQEAIQGRLVAQDASDEPAYILLQRINEEKLQLVKEGKLKKKDVVDSVIFKGDDNKYFEKKDKDIICIDEEIPFEIPDTWVWARLEDICEYIQRGKSPQYSPVKKYPVIAQKCNQWSGFSIEKAQFIVPETISSYGEERKLQDRDLLWNSTGLGTLGRMAIYYSKLNPYELAVADSHVTVIRPLKKHVSPEYLYAYFSSYTVQSVIEDKSDGSTKQKELATNTVKAYLVPLPPYEEQKRIVNRIDEVIAHLT